MFKFKTYAKVELVNDDGDLLKKALAGHVDIPKDTPFDLLFFKAVYLTSGANLNHTYFDKAELVKSIDTVANKAMDIEHEEQGVVGHIYAASFFDSDKESSIEACDVENYDGRVDVVIAGVVYKDRFPKLAADIAKGKWYVSMETYYDSFDIKIGDVLLDYNTASSLGIVDLVGQEVVLKKSGEVFASGVANKVVRNLHFSGGGFVKNPAEPRAVVLDTAQSKVVDISVATFKDNKIDYKEKILDMDKDKKKIDLKELNAFVEDFIEKKEEDFYCVDCEALLSEIDMAVKDVSSLIANKDFAKKWTRKYINDLPDSAFIIIEPDYKNGKTDNKNARHLPYKDDKGKVDLPHLRNALARCNQLVPVTKSISQDSLRSKACKKAQSLAKKYLKKK